MSKKNIMEDLEVTPKEQKSAKVFTLYKAKLCRFSSPVTIQGENTKTQESVIQNDKYNIQVLSSGFVEVREKGRAIVTDKITVVPISQVHFIYPEC